MPRHSNIINDNMNLTNAPPRPRKRRGTHTSSDNVESNPGSHNVSAAEGSESVKGNMNDHTPKEKKAETTSPVVETQEGRRISPPHGNMNDHTSRGKKGETSSPAVETYEGRPRSRRSFREEDAIEDNAAERSLIAEQLEEAEQFNLTIEYVDEPMQAEEPAAAAPPSSKSSSGSLSTGGQDEEIELEPTEARTSPVNFSVSSVKKPTDSRLSIAKELLNEWESPAIVRKRRSNADVFEEGAMTPKRRVP